MLYTNDLLVVVVVVVVWGGTSVSSSRRQRFAVGARATGSASMLAQRPACRSRKKGRKGGVGAGSGCREEMMEMMVWASMAPHFCRPWSPKPSPLTPHPSPLAIWPSRHLPECMIRGTATRRRLGFSRRPAPTGSITSRYTSFGISMSAREYNFAADPTSQLTADHPTANPIVDPTGNLLPVLRDSALYAETGLVRMGSPRPSLSLSFLFSHRLRRQPNASLSVLPGAKALDDRPVRTPSGCAHRLPAFLFSLWISHRLSLFVGHRSSSWRTISGACAACWPPFRSLPTSHP